MYLFDTNVVSELRKPWPHGSVVAWIHSVDEATLHLATVTLGEIQVGIERTREQDTEEADEIETWLDLVTESYNILPMDGPAFRCWAKLMHRKSDTLYEDAMIAAIAQVHGLTVVTRNIDDFAGFGVTLLNPFEFRAST
jgi:predicted nucleic acid-binding protein